MKDTPIGVNFGESDKIRRIIYKDCGRSIETCLKLKKMN